MGRKRDDFTFVELGLRVYAEAGCPRIAVGRAMEALAPWTPGPSGRPRNYELAKGEKLTVIIERLD